MTYYHLIVEDKNGNTRFLKDQEDLKVINEKSTQYINNEDFRIDGYTFNKKTNVERFKIVSTEAPLKQIADLKTNECIRNRIIMSYSEEDVVNSNKLSKDITDEVLDNLKANFKIK